MSDAKMKNADVSLVGTGIAWEPPLLLSLIRTNMFRCFRWPVLTATATSAATMKSSFIIATSIPLPPLVSIPKWLCVGRITSLPMTFLSSLTGAPTVWR